MKALKSKQAYLMLALLMALSVILAACGDNTATTAPALTTAAATTAAATTAASTTAAATTAAATTAASTTAAATTAASTTAAATTATSATTAASGSSDSVTVSVNGTPVTIKAGGGQSFKPANPVTVTMWSYQVKQNGEAFRKLMDEFEQTHPNIKVKIDNFNDTATYDIINQKLTQAATAGGLPNIANGYENWVPAFVDSKVILPLNQFISGPYGLTGKELNDYRPQMLARGIFPQYNNETYTWVFSNSAPVLYYNKDILDKYGISKVPETWDEFIADGKTIAEKSGGKTAGYVFAPKTVSEIVAGIYSRGGQVYDYKANKLVMTDKPAVDHITMLYQGVKDGWIITADPNVAFDDQNRFLNGEVAFYISSTSGRSFIAAAQAKDGAKKFNWNAQVIPHGTGLQPVTTLYGGAVMGFKGKSQDEDLATWEVMKYLGSAAFQAKFAASSGYAPATKSTLEDPGYKAFLDKAPQNKIPLVAYDYATAAEPKIGQWQQMRNIFNDAMFALFQNASGDPAATLKKIEDDSNKLLK
ncbi:MAG TPA: ABC transporter substrate-binding protein [Chloroflexia bacterium]|nr:ABC transporter substrate-binding protein [Chloroflexia bacterium]